MARKQTAASAQVIVAASAPQVSEVQALVTAMFNVADSTLNAKALAFDLLADLKTVEDVNKVRDDFKAKYAEGYKAKYPANKAEDCTNACNMAWSRVCAYAKEKGWDKPQAEGAKATKAREARADASKGKVDGRTAKAKGAKVDGVVVGKAGDDLDVAMQTIRGDAELRAMFDAWYAKAQQFVAVKKSLAA